MRKYEEIWQQVKTTGVCSLIAHPSLHRRIKKAVSKEKCADVAYKLHWDMQDYPQPELVRSVDPSNPNILTFTLTYPVTLGDM